MTTDSLPLPILVPYPRELWDRQDERAWPWLEAGYKHGWFASLPWTAKSEPNVGRKRAAVTEEK